ncbi:MAG: hypothetical protein ABF325_01410 [Lentimonas sp.]
MRGSKVRLQEVIRELAQTSVKKKAKRKVAKKKAASGNVAVSAKSNIVSDVVSTVMVTRHLTARSTAMRESLLRISEAANKASLILIEGEGGAEYELAARELNIRANGDVSTLMVLDPMHLRAAQLWIL